jgi:capsular exopolysaccharide synthesis family protein
MSDSGDYERLASAILQAMAGAPFKTMMVVAPERGEGTSTVATGLARTLGTRIRVVLVDGDFRSPSLAGRFDLDDAAGLADVLAGRALVAAVAAETDVANLRVVAAGGVADDSIRLLSSPRLSGVVQELAADSDLVILDVPPVLRYADSLSIASRVERVVLVTCAERTQRGDLERAKDELEKSGAVILGVVLNRKPSHAPPWIQRYLNL